MSSRQSRPMLADLHAFDSAARHLSFTRAAAELCLTQGAISQRIKRREDKLGVKLFERWARMLELTMAGKTLATAVSDGLIQIDEGLAAIEQQSSLQTARSAYAQMFVEWLRTEIASWRSSEFEDGAPAPC